MTLSGIYIISKNISMRVKQLLWATLVMVSSNAFGQTDTATANWYHLTGRICSKVELTPHCGIFAFATVIELDIVYYSDTSYHGRRIAVIVTCPEMYKSGFFGKGNLYEMKIVDRNLAGFGWMIPNEYLIRKYKMKYEAWVAEAKQVNNPSKPSL